MRRILYIALVMCLVIKATNAQNVTFNFTDGIEAGSLKTKVEKNLSLFLTNINKASRQGAEEVNLSSVQITEQTKEAFDELWKFQPFKCADTENWQSCIRTKTGYSVRQIPVIVNDKDTLGAPSMRELTIEFNNNGQITGVFFALEQHNIDTILRTGSAVKDTRERQEILNFVERYRSYYDQKDIKSIEDIFSDDALIITGTVGMKKTPEGGMEKTVTYKQQNKEEYIKNLRETFRRNSYIKVKFSGAEVIAHPTRDDIYMVRLHQNWRSTKADGRKYEDNGYVTLLWKFPENGDDPRIMVRTWQEASTVKSEDDVFNLNDFKIY